MFSAGYREMFRFEGRIGSLTWTIDPILALFAPMQLRLLTPVFLQRSLLVLCIALKVATLHQKPQLRSSE